MNVVSFLCLLRQESFSAFSYSSRQSHKYTNSRKLTLLIYTNFQLFSLRACFSGNISHFCCLRSGCSGAVVGTRFIASKSLENPSAKTGVFGAEIGNWFSERLPQMGERKKLVARISKSEPLILKSKPLIFLPHENPFENRPGNADKNDTLHLRRVPSKGFRAEWLCAFAWGTRCPILRRQTCARPCAAQGRAGVSRRLRPLWRGRNRRRQRSPLPRAPG